MYYKLDTQKNAFFTNLTKSRCGPQYVSIHFTFLVRHQIILLIDACTCNVVGKKTKYEYECSLSKLKSFPMISKLSGVRQGNVFGQIAAQIG